MSYFTHYLKKIVALPFLWVPGSTEIPILAGPNRGLKWVMDAGIHQCWIGSYEMRQVLSVRAAVKPGMTVFDVGAHAGYYTLMFSRAVGPTGKVFAFEASPENAARLRHHLSINGLTNVEVVEAAVTDRTGTARFTSDGYVGKLSDTGREVRTVCLDDYPLPDLIKMDIEGAETMALSGASKLLSGRPKLFVAVHEGPSLVECPALLERAGYSLNWVTNTEMWAIPT